MKPNLNCLFKIIFASVAISGCASSLIAQEFVWTQGNAPATNWQAVASSSSGNKLVAVGSSGGIYCSTNSGTNWTRTSAPNLSWSSVASSSDGMKLAAVVYGGGIYFSMDSGASWTNSNATNLSWQAIASSSDGTKLVAVTYGGFNTSTNGGIYTSSDSGRSWSKTSAPMLNGIVPNWRSVASSSDGTKLVAGIDYGVIFISRDSGLTWAGTSVPNGSAAQWYSVASSSDGRKLVAVTPFLGIWSSTNSGTNWTQAPGTTSATWHSVASSSDGSNMTAAAVSGQISRSTNSGLTWISTGAPGLSWRSVASSADGSRLAAASFDPYQAGAGIYAGKIRTYPPEITEQPVSVFMCPNSTTILEVAATGTPPLYYQWRKSGTNLLDGGHVLGAATTNLTLSNVSDADTANYDVVITNETGSITSSVVTVIVTILPAKATPIIVNGFIVGVNLSNGGCGYTNPPTIIFSGQGGNGATGYAQISNGSVTNIVITAAGAGYPSNAALFIAPPLYPTLSIVQLLTNTPSATATPIVTNGFVVGANITASGSGYTTNPTVSFSDVSGHGAAAYSQIGNGSVTNIVFTSAGSGYTSNAVINISPTPTMRVVIPSAKSLMLGQNYQLQIANDLNGWMSCGAVFSATASDWAATNFWNVANTNLLFFRMQMFP